MGRYGNLWPRLCDQQRLATFSCQSQTVEYKVNDKVKDKVGDVWVQILVMKSLHHISVTISSCNHFCSIHWHPYQVL